MLMVIFGAGASYDSSPDLPLSSPNQWRPPLATALFADPSDVFGDIVKGYDKLRPILPRLRRPTQGTTVEQELEKLRAEADGNPERTRQLFSVRYYLHDLFRRISREWLKRTNRVTNYGTLLDQIRHLNSKSEPVCLVMKRSRFSEE